MIAEAGIVIIQAQIMLPATPQRTAESRFVAPTPIMAPAMVWVVLTAIPKTPLYDRLQTEGRLDLDDDSGYGTNVIPLNMTREELREGYLQLMRDVYDPDAYFERLEDLYLPYKPKRRTRAGIAREMIRVCRPQGYLFLVDWWMPKPLDANYKALTRPRLRRLFAPGERTKVVGIFRGALAPPLGRFLSAFVPWLYFPVATVCPFLVGQVVYVLRKDQMTAAGETRSPLQGDDVPWSP